MADESFERRTWGDAVGSYTICKMSAGGYVVMTGQIVMAQIACTTLDEAFSYIRSKAEGQGSEAAGSPHTRQEGE
jgi:hypothetical protein